MPLVESIFRLIIKCQIKDLPLKNTYLLTIGLHILYLISDTIHNLLFYHIGLRDPFKSNCFKTLFFGQKNIIKNKVLTIKRQEFKTCLTTLNYALTLFSKAGQFPSFFWQPLQPTSKRNKITMRLRTNQESYAHRHSHGIYRCIKIRGIHFT
jgi:hypothetical protein